MGVVCLMASCAQEKFDSTIIPTPGEEVRFSASVNEGPQTRTLYGADAADSIRVKWVNGDTISVFGTTGGKQQAKYTVLAATASSNTPNVDDGQVYADDLQKTAINGVQWGEEETANFTAIYPSLGSSFPEDGQIKATINATQNYVFPTDPTADKLTGVDVDGNEAKIDLWEGTHFGNNASNPTMQNAIMYARTEGVKNGDTVNLLFKPFATVLKFRFMGFNSSLSDPTIHVQSITVTAPTGYAIAGDFTLDVTGSYDEATATTTAAGNNSNTITLNTILPGGTYLPLKKHQAVDFNVFTIPLDNLKMGGAVTKETVNGKATYTCEHPWKITIQTAQHGTFTYNVIPNVNGITEFADGTYTAASFTLAKGQIHKVKVPQLTVNGTVEWDPSQWMKQIPKPVYLSELSVPGAWYCMDDDYQGSIGLGSDALTYKSQKTTGTDGAVTSYYTTTSAANNIDDGLEHLYYNGIRAFNIDCRTSKTNCNDGVGITGTAERQWSDSDYANNSYLACAGTENPWGASPYTIYIEEGIYVINVVKNLITLAQAHPDEYIVIVFTYAEKPSTTSGILAGTVNPLFITEQLNTILIDQAIAPYLYTGITPDTTIEDVLTADTNGIVRNVIVKINHSNVDFATSTSPSFSMPSGIMASFGSMAMSDYIQTYVTDITTSAYSSYYKTMQSYPIYNGKTANNMTYYYHQAQKTESSTTASGTTYPSVYDRLAAVDDVLEQATTIYDNSSHNALFQLGIGGSIDNDQSALAQAMNNAVRTKIEAKIASDASPIGFVLMNYATDATYGLPLVKDIISMNGKFYLKRKGNDVTTGNGGTDNTNPQAVPTSNGAYAVVGEDAF